MRKVLSIFLLLVLLFNMVGYRAWFYYAEKHSDAAMEARLERNQFQENDLVSLTIPLNNPYLLEQSSFERVNGDINFQGESFKIVERKVSEGKLILRCMPNTGRSVLKKAKTEYGNAVNDLSSAGKSSSRSMSQKNFSHSDYTEHSFNMSVDNFPQGHRPFRNAVSISNLCSPYLTAPGKPPRTLA